MNHLVVTFLSRFPSHVSQHYIFFFHFYGKSFNVSCCGKEIRFWQSCLIATDLFKVKSFTIYIHYDILLTFSFVVDDIDSETDRLEVNIRCYESDVTRNNFPYLNLKF